MTEVRFFGLFVPTDNQLSHFLAHIGGLHYRKSATGGYIIMSNKNEQIIVFGSPYISTHKQTNDNNSKYNP